ncbi:MAG: hypothetical protein EHM58_08505 [Ignavibacteriae bacterium]|nr:MAG: hypothetical protein EHM58_08505 [Ignavibacteriota bacterium]
MKQKLTGIGLLFFISVLVYGLIIPAKMSTPPQSKNAAYFPLGAMHNQIDYDHQYITDPSKFGMNLWHYYTGSHRDTVRHQWQPMGWSTISGDRADSLYADYNSYWPGVKLFLDKEAGLFHPNDPSFKMKMLMQRPKIEWLSYGQRSDYQCETILPSDYKWFYSFNTHETGDNKLDSGQMVRVCRTMPDFPIADSPGFIVKKLKANNEQNNTPPFDTYYHGDDSQYRWYIKPRIRIDPDFAVNNPNVPVCSVNIVSSDSVTLRNVILKGRNFWDQYDKYDGRYLEQYRIFSGDDTLEVQGAWGSNTRRMSRGNEINEGSGISQMDIQVYWYGNCNMWIDYVRVDNEIANRLLKSGGDDEYERWIRWEADIANYIPPNLFKPQFKFYIEEFEFNNIPCMGYVNKKLQQLTSPDTVDLMACYYYGLFRNHLPWNDYNSLGMWTDTKKLDADIVNELLIQPTGMRHFFTEIYPFTSNDVKKIPPEPLFSKLPVTIPSTNTGCIYAILESPDSYDTWLQTQLDNPSFPTTEYESGWFTNAIKLANDLTKISGKQFITMPQTHSCQTTGIENRREPTNEEIRLTTNLALSYGTKGIIYFWYGGYGDCSPEVYNAMNGFLTMEVNGLDTSYVPRTNNSYEQNKWDGLIALHKQIRQWAPYFLNFNTAFTNSYIYYKDNERQSFLTKSYFNYIASFKPGDPQVLCPGEIEKMSDIPPEQNLIFDCQSETYVQAATFKVTGSSTPYFMIINRRCSPVKTGFADGRRKIKVIFDSYHNDINSSEVWDIKDLGQPGEPTVTSFYRPGALFADLGWFEPGEAKLYKLVPL